MAGCAELRTGNGKLKDGSLVRRGTYITIGLLHGSGLTSIDLLSLPAVNVLALEDLTRTTVVSAVSPPTGEQFVRVEGCPSLLAPWLTRPSCPLSDVSCFIPTF
jgi:hypothetical protein